MGRKRLLRGYSLSPAFPFPLARSSLFPLSCSIGPGVILTCFFDGSWLFLAFWTGTRVDWLRLGLQYFALVETAFFPGLDLDPDLLAQMNGEQGGKARRLQDKWDRDYWRHISLNIILIPFTFHC